MTDEDKRFLLWVVGLTSVSVGVYLYERAKAKERKAQKQSNEWTLMTLLCLRNLGERLETVMDDPEKNIKDLVDALQEETAFLSIVLDEVPLN